MRLGFDNTAHASSAISLVRDTVLASVSNALELNETRLAIQNSVIRGSGGDGVRCILPGEYGSWEVGPVSVTGSEFSDNAGRGLFIQDSTYRGGLPREIASCLFSGNGGDGLRLEAPNGNVHDCVASGNGGNGLSCLATFTGLSRRIVSNTSALNQGDGFFVPGPSSPGDSLQVVQHNLAAANGGAGFTLPVAAVGSFAFNDAWGNSGAAYAGPASPADSNLTVDPLFCDLAGGDLGLQQGSPCGGGGVYGLIGALPEACPLIVGVEPAPLPGVAFAVRPSVARGSVEFVVPAGFGDARVELYDVGGRAVWRTTIGAAGGTVRWRGEGTNGRVPAGLYWARYTRGPEVASRRLVWLE